VIRATIVVLCIWTVTPKSTDYVVLPVAAKHFAKSITKGQYFASFLSGMFKIQPIRLNAIWLARLRSIGYTVHSNYSYASGCICVWPVGVIAPAGRFFFRFEIMIQFRYFIFKDQ
jgi:hypothetical protein